MRGNSKIRGLSASISTSLMVVPMLLLAQPGRGIPRPHEDRLLGLAQQIPGFGGFSFDSLGNLHVFLTDTTKASGARELLTPILASRSKGRRDRLAQRPEIVVHVGQFDFPTLRSWHDSLSMRVLALDGAVYTDISENRNRIVIGIDRQNASVGRSNVQQALARLHVPPGMVDLVETVGFVMDTKRATCNPCAPGSKDTGPQSSATFSGATLYGFVSGEHPRGYGPSMDATSNIQFAPGPKHQPAAPSSASTLSDRLRPLEGGLETDYYRQSDNSYHGCTLGFLAYRNQQRVLITASHCSSEFGAPDGTGYYQPSVQVGNYAGAETADPAYTTSSMCDDPEQPGTNRPCRDSDALAALLATDVTWSLGRIAKPTGTGTFSYTAFGSTTIDAAQPHLTIIAKGAYPDVNMILDKIGRSSGWTYGYVAQTCVNLRAPYLSQGITVVLRCQDLVESTAVDGDSGAPVFQWGDTGVTLYGIVSARRANGQGLSMSAMSNIEYDLGPLTVF
jgi:hypothetical protein